MDDSPDRVAYSDALADEICRRLVEGESVHAICRTEGMPNPRTVYRWLQSNADFRTRYELAREQQADRYFAEIIAIADDASGDIETDGKVDWENIQRSRLRCDARKWVCAKLMPTKYSDVTKLEHTGAGGKPLIPATPFGGLDADGKLAHLMRVAYGITSLMTDCGVNVQEAASFSHSWFVEMRRRLSGERQTQPAALLPAPAAASVYTEVATDARLAHPGFAEEEPGGYTSQAEEERLAMRRIEGQGRRRPVAVVTRRAQQ